MAGGIFLSQNKTRAGVYVNFQTHDTNSAAVGERGITAIALNVDFGPDGLTAVDQDTDVLKIFGLHAGNPALLPIREAAKRAKKVLVFRLGSGDKASAAGGNLRVSAKYGGTRGNSITITSAKEGDAFRVVTWMDGVQVDMQTAKTVSELKSNSWADFSGSGALSEQAGIRLTGGTNNPITAENWNEFFHALETADFQTFAVSSSDASVKSAALAFVKKMRETEGSMIQGVLADYPQADYEGIISVKNGVILEDGTEISKENATAYVAGMTAGAQVNESNTFGVYDGASDVPEHLTGTQIMDALSKGEWVFLHKNGKVVVEQDLNTFTSFSVRKGQAFSKNRLIRVMDTMANDIRTLFEQKYLGKEGNSSDGRSLFRAELAGYLSNLEELGAIDGFDAQADIEVLPGNAADAVVVNLAVRPVDSMEKLYMTVDIQ